MPPLPELSRFELQCLRVLWSSRTASIREIHEALETAAGYTTVKKIVERLEEKGAIERVRRDGRAWIYRSRVKPSAMIRRELRRMLDTLFNGEARPLVAHLADMDELSVDDLAEIEKIVTRERRAKKQRGKRR